MSVNSCRTSSPTTSLDGPPLITHSSFVVKRAAPRKTWRSKHWERVRCDNASPKHFDRAHDFDRRSKLVVFELQCSMSWITRGYSRGLLHRCISSRSSGIS
ncbi:hypothetical protein BDR07DRAFT_1409194 [Suillus spraguei]|nr:hypothetical protein BDR07DRAFT_1409194 [Suillus spraguei]